MTNRITYTKYVAMFATFLFALLCFSSIALASAAIYPEYSQYDYVIENYDVKIVAHNDNTYLITEIIDVDHQVERHGIYRDIPRIFGDVRASVTNIDVGGEQKKIIWSPTLTRIRLGDPDSYILGKKRYTISYVLDLGKDRYPDRDSLYLNIIGTEWNAPILEARFEVDLNEVTNYPYSVKLHAGARGSTDYTNYVNAGQVNGIVKGHLVAPLGPYEGITIKADMTEGTFQGARDPFDVIKLIGYVVGATASMLIIVFFLSNISADRPVPVVEFHAPDDLNPVEIGYIIDEKVNNKDVGAMIVCWASHGHLSIEEREDDEFTIVKINDMDEEHRDYEIEAFNELFKLGDGERVDSSDLTNKFYEQAYKIRSGAARPYAKKGDKQLYSSKADKLSHKVLVLGMLCTFTILFLVLWCSIPIENNPAFTAMVYSYVLTFVYLGVSLLYKTTVRLKNKVAKWKTALLTVVTVVLVLVIFFLIIIDGADFIDGFAIGLLVLPAILAIFISPHMRRYSDSGKRLVERVLGFQKFIEDTEEDRIKRLFDDNPSYFYDILPYAIVLGVTNKWTEKFGELSIDSPKWYKSYNGELYSHSYFMRNVMRTTGRISRATTSTPGRGFGSTGSYTGGGFTGGGGGGGGGGTW